MLDFPWLAVPSYLEDDENSEIGLRVRVIVRGVAGWVGVVRRRINPFAPYGRVALAQRWRIDWPGTFLEAASPAEVVVGWVLGHARGIDKSKRCFRRDPAEAAAAGDRHEVRSNRHS
jgi:hypothetical protein